MAERPNGKRRWRFRFSLGTLLAWITAICGCFGVLRLQFWLVEILHFNDLFGNLADTLPGDAYQWLFALQSAGLLLGIAILVVSRQPKSLYVYVAGQSVWVALMVVNLIMEVVVWEGTLGVVTLAIYFCEPACGLVLAAFALSEASWQRWMLQVWGTAALVAFGLVATLLTVSEIQAFAAALGAVLSGGL